MSGLNSRRCKATRLNASGDSADASRTCTTKVVSSSELLFPELCVFDLDACLWNQEMFELYDMPDKAVYRPLRDAGKGVAGVMSGRTEIALHEGALIALQEYHAGAYPGMRIAAASSADTPLAVRIGTAALKMLEVVPGVTVWEVFAKGWPDSRNMQIGRTPPLSSNKSQTHFPILREGTGVRYDKMLFFDDSNWSDHCAIVSRYCREEDTEEGVVSQRTPRGLREVEWREGLRSYNIAATRRAGQ